MTMPSRRDFGACARLDQWGLEINHRLLVAGPCSAESPEQVRRTFAGLSATPAAMFRAGVWKPRTRPGGFEGLGEAALPWLVRAAHDFGRPLAVEVALPAHVQACLRHGVDAVWIGARSTANPFSVQPLADALRGVDIPVLVKNPICPELALWLGALERFEAAGVRRLAAVHRGFCVSEKTMYRYPPMWELPRELMRHAPGLPVLCDPSHICGRAEMVGSVARRALDLGFSGLMIEAHEAPHSALSDAAQQLRPATVGRLALRLGLRGPGQASGMAPEAAAQ